MGELEKWDYSQSVEKMRPLVEKWFKVSIEMARELTIAQICLSQRPKKEKLVRFLTSGISVDNLLITTNKKKWIEYLNDIGLTRDKAHYWMNRYDIDNDILLDSPIRDKPIIDTSKLILPEGKYFIIYADPPWKYDFSATKSRSIEMKYPTLTVDQIIEYKDKTGRLMTDLFNKDCILLMWATAPKLREAMSVIENWEFDYKTHAIWDKEKIGMGYWFRGQHELLTVSTKGKVIPPKEEDRFSSVMRFKRENLHSKKPDECYDLIEKWFPVNIEKPIHIELFKRNERTGWEGFGSEFESA